jgi:hypothetical protein
MSVTSLAGVTRLGVRTFTGSCTIEPVRLNTDALT